MRKIGKCTALIAICAIAGFALVPQQSQAGVMTMADRATIAPDSPIQEAHHWRRHWHHHHWHHRHWHHHHWRHHHWRRHHWGHWPYRYYGYYPWQNPVGALAGAAVGVATAPLWALGGYPYPYYYY